MPLWLDKKYVSLSAPYLERFVWKHPTLANFRCPLCGDSQRNKTKTRGYCYPYKDKYFFKCQNCSVALPFGALLKKLSPALYNEYLLERLREQHPPEAPAPAQAPPQRRVPCPDGVFPLGACMDSQKPLYAVYEYAYNRKIPVPKLDRLFATRDAFSVFAPLVGSEKAAKVQDNVSYLVMPLTLPDGTWYGAQLRAIDSKMFTTFRWSHEPLKMFGLGQWDSGTRTYVLESPIDSLFVPNALAALGSDLLSALHVVEDAYLVEDRVLVWDNEPRNADVRRHLRGAINVGEKVVIWPRDWPKDVNDMVRVGLSVETVLNTIETRTFSGLRAELEFSQWSQ